ncbi:hypothetical protein LS68_004445 [Helicobacter sp. MIT 05-5293]|uniref:hypothetical protein n=1 Tax=Helicobacter sp. MIT 05-5293 TaxID=1548149 RepID=UPI00051D78C8|nr:hypothetical protein [Helicobacter sp. MIT 05-5293]TLD82244.1 hypothetical protein LS68_004445 [Helicobacter sp. MIT 05-5293]
MNTNTDTKETHRILKNFDFNFTKAENFSFFQKICKYLAIVLLLLEYLIFRILAHEEIANLFITALFTTALILYFKKETFRISLLMSYVAVIALCWYCKLILWGDVNLGTGVELEEMLSGMAASAQITTKEVSNLLHSVLSSLFFFTLFFVVFLFSRSFQSKMPLVFLIYVISIPIWILLKLTIWSVEFA